MSLGDYIGVLLLGLLGGGHCVGMCGVFSVAISAGAPRPLVVVWRQLAYQAGKATAYVLLGVLLLAAGTLAGARDTLSHAQSILGWLAGAVMIAAGLAYALEVRGPAPLARWWRGSAACAALAVLWRSPSLAKSLLAGWVNGFLPCGLSWTALLYLASFGSPTGLVAGAYLFGLATMPGLLAAALLGQRIHAGARRWLVRASGVALVIFGVLTLVRGEPRVHAWFHEHLMPDAGVAGAPHEHHEHHGHQ
ncbi:sulfite exporter TauE/SafE family protein [Termitidicoccus mucosus]|uniref:Urease accessory protein UreH-like transmembrane domain-containing protein n=1 Tax=Termitidicoccus mucosus TaxID=1184151 RepID=A0A178IN99_9BACT|nr:hypothetical protein AW736_07075 [Opitutaceae bacterium TSB47]